MKYWQIVFINVIYLYININCDTYLGENVFFYPELENYQFTPNLGDCYEIYDQHEKVTPFSCRKKINIEKQSCIDWISTERFCLGMKTPTNETIEFICGDTKDEVVSNSNFFFEKCYNVRKVNGGLETTCLKNFETYSTGITTPDGYSILFGSYFCDPVLKITNRNKFNSFVTNFSFDPEIRSCFKIFQPDQDATPYTCLNTNIYESCIQQLPNKNCFGIATQNNETIVLECTNNSTISKGKNCLELYDTNGNVHISCLEKVEERCVGFVTPSNLTVLVECYFCAIKPFWPMWAEDNVKFFKNNAEKQRKYRKFIKTYLNNEYQGKNSYLDKIYFLVFGENDMVRPPNCNENSNISYTYWLPNSNCFGISLENNETVILRCTDSAENHIQPGCFKVINQEGLEYTTCIKILEERCVGITTAGNISVALACYQEYYCQNYADKEKMLYAEKSADSYKLFPTLGTCYELYLENEVLTSNICTEKARPENYTCIDWIPRRNNHCLGLTTPANETIEIICGESPDDVFSYEAFSRLKPCFTVYKSDESSTEICQKKIGDFFIGFTTPSNYIVILESFFCETFKSQLAIEEYQQFIKNFSLNPEVRSCYKIFREDQDVSPRLCLSKDIYETCIHDIKDTSCSGITTQNNETLILSCTDNNEIAPMDGCFKIYSPNNEIYIACQEKLEESCVGIITPSNLKILFECFRCSSPQGQSLPQYNSDRRKEYRPYVKSVLGKYRKGEIDFHNNETLQISKPEQYLIEVDCQSIITSYDIHILHGHGDCLGVSLDNHETVVLECPNKIPKIPGCFDVFSPINDNEISGPDQKVQSVCAKVLLERCVGIVTPKNWTIPLSCTPILSRPACATISVPPNVPPRM